MPVVIFTEEQAKGEEESSNYIYTWREAESWDRSHNINSYLNWDFNTNAPLASDNCYTLQQNTDNAGDYAEWDFNVYDSGTYYFWVRGYYSGILNICENVTTLWNEIQIGDSENWHLTIGTWQWCYFGSKYLSEGI